MSDSILRAIADNNANLESFSCANDDNITYEGLKYFMDTCVNLRTIVISECIQIETLYLVELLCNHQSLNNIYLRRQDNLTTAHCISIVKANLNLALLEIKNCPCVRMEEVREYCEKEGLSCDCVSRTH